MIAYRRFLKEMWALMFPRQKNKGGGAVQVGRLNGNVTVINHHHATNSSNDKPTPGERRATPAQRDVLDLMNRVPDRTSVLKFMEREFATRMVIELQPTQLYRLRRYLEVVIAKTGAVSAKQATERPSEISADASALDHPARHSRVQPTHPQSQKPTGITSE